MPDARFSNLLRPSRYAAQLIASRPELGAELSGRLDAPFTRDEMRAALSNLAATSETEAAGALRRLRQRVFLLTMARDLAGLADLDEVCATMSDLAETSIAAALEVLDTKLGAEFGTPCDAAGVAQPLIVIGMGKLGGRELNVSSDIDLVFVYPEDGDTRGAARSVSNHEYFTRLGRRMIALLAEPTGDGIVFRVDMRLRPNGDSGPLVSSYGALETYFVTQGRDWERYAWIKARPITGAPDEHAGLEAIRMPFVFRKYLDYASLTAMRRLHAEVRREVARRDLADHIKLGPGGIREIEFIAQAAQLVRGGRDPALAARPTRTVLSLLAERRLLPETAARELAEDYVFLRNLEHRLQYLDDAQTHRLPASDEDRTRIAEMAGFPGWTECEARLQKVRGRVSAHFEEVFAEEEAGESAFDGVWQDDTKDDRQAVAVLLGQHGYADPQACAQRLAAARSSQRYVQLPEESRRRFDALVPQLVAAAAKTGNPDATLARGLDLIEAIARRAAYLALLAEHPQALERVARMIGASSWAAEFVTRHPLLLDELLDDRVLYADPDWQAFGAELRAQLAGFEGDAERQMNVLREAHQSQVFRLLAKDLAGLLTVERLADHLSTLADLVLEITLALVWSQLSQRHRETPSFAVVAYGKLGGKELGYASDLDIIFLYDDADAAAPETYARLAQRLNNWLTSRTSSGVLFETDLRLRPSGASGLLVSTIEAFREYQQKHAWSWEHQALTRARYSAGDAAVGAQFEAIRIEILKRLRDPKALAQEVSAMREKMRAAHPNKSGLFDVKHDRGAMIDIEFIVQFLVLAHSHRHHALTENLGNIALLRIAADLGLIAAPLAEGAREAYREFRRIQHALRLNGAQYARVPPEQIREHAQAVQDLWKIVLG